MMQMLICCNGHSVDRHLLQWPFCAYAFVMLMTISVVFTLAIAMLVTMVIQWLLQGVQNRRFLQGMPELGLKSAITHRESEDEYGHLVNEALKVVRVPIILCLVFLFAFV